MSETGTSIMHSHKKCPGDPPPEPFMLPTWALEILRTVLRKLFEWVWRTRFNGTENIPLIGGLIIAANHQTYVDPFWLSVPVRRPLRFLAWDAIFDWPVAGRLMRWLGAWPLQLDKSDPRAIRRSLQWLREGGAVVIFPEGGRAHSDGAMRKFKTGAARMALEANVPVLPVTIRGGHRVWPRDQRFPRRGHVEIIYHPLYRLHQLPGEDTRHCARRESDAISQIIHSAL